MLDGKRAAKKAECDRKKSHWWIKHSEIQRKEKELLEYVENAKRQLEEQQKERANLLNDYDRAALELEELDEIVAEKARLITEECAKAKQN